MNQNILKFIRFVISPLAAAISNILQNLNKGALLEALFLCLLPVLYLHPNVTYHFKHCDRPSNHP